MLEVLTSRSLVWSFTNFNTAGLFYAYCMWLSSSNDKLSAGHWKPSRLVPYRNVIKGRSNRVCSLEEAISNVE